MSGTLLVALGVVVIVGVQGWARRTGVAAPLLLVLLGVAVSFVPAVPAVEIEPEWILAGVLPPLLYSAAVQMPTMDFRRDLGPISSLSVFLVLVTTVGLGFFFHLVLDVDLAVAIALGAVVSPTDAVATTIVKRLGAPRRVVTVLEGESLLNDATALVLLRSAIAATAGAVSLWGVAGDFLAAVGIAVAIGLLVGVLNLRLRRATHDAAASTAISFIAPFVAAVPAEHLGASGLVAAVTAGLVTGQGSARYLRPQDRMAERSNWATVELVLEGGIFLVMGLELYGIVADVQEEHASVAFALGIGAAAAGLALVVRSLYVAPLLWLVQRRTIDPGDARARMAAVSARIESADLDHDDPRVRRRLQGWSERVTQRLADIDYLARSPLGRREGALLVWAGMRGAVTLAAAQTLPADTPRRSLLLLIAFVVAAGSLLVQGGTLGFVARVLGLQGTTQDAPEERRLLIDAMARGALALLQDPGLKRSDGSTYSPDVVERARATATRLATDAELDDVGPRHAVENAELRLRLLDAQRRVLLEARKAGTFRADALSSALDALDAEQISIELRTRHLTED
ncbi:cation:proton antiporter [Cellulomonas massiliensis]|uniref:cation:proton antiporter n=1 Tax=Cellulomonas massiliensis TaxID=1465811 RepID=UPI0002FA7DB2|nr:sodium:proton antiporter [Cellulomonas massiliensis]